MLPEDIINKIMFYNSHPIADIMKESSIFKYRELSEALLKLPEHSPREILGFSFEVGCANAYYRDYNLEGFCFYNYRELEDDEMFKQAILNYNVGYMHTIMSSNENESENENEVVYEYNFKVINTLPKLRFAIRATVLRRCNNTLCFDEDVERNDYDGTPSSYEDYDTESSDDER